MISASEARKSTEMAIEATKSTSEYKTAMHKVEEYIKKAMLAGQTSFRYNLCAMCEAYGHPSSAVTAAVADELRKHGFSYREMSVMNIGGSYNSCFEVSW